jgi:hypothetical protein
VWEVADVVWNSAPRTKWWEARLARRYLEGGGAAEKAKGQEDMHMQLPIGKELHAGIVRASDRNSAYKIMYK